MDDLNYSQSQASDQEIEALFKPIVFLRQFFDESLNRVSPIDDTPFEGFDDSGVESIGELIRRMSVGQEVQRFADGVYEDDQVFDTEFVDTFDILDRQVELENEQFSGAGKLAGQDKKPESANADDNSPLSE